MAHIQLISMAEPASPVGRSQPRMRMAGATRDSDWNKAHPARNDWPSPWSDAYSMENRNRGLIRLSTPGQKK